MTGRFLASVAVAALISLGFAGTAGAQTNTGRNTTMDHGTMSQDRSMHQSMGKQKNRSSRSAETAQARREDNMADQLNSCGAKPESERQACLDRARQM